MKEIILMNKQTYFKKFKNIKYPISRRGLLISFMFYSFFHFSRKLYANGEIGGPFRDRFQSFRQTFRVEPNPEEAKRIINNIIKGRDKRNNLILLNAPDIAENGNVVPINFSVNCSMNGNDYPKVVHILVLDNPFPEIVKFFFSNQSGSADLAIRIRMRQSSEVVAIAEMADGTVGEDRFFVDVTIGACS